MLGSGGFQLYDGIFQHKLMKIHQIRYVDNVLIYDVIWNIIATVMILIGILLVFQTRTDERLLRGKSLNEQ